MAVTTLTPSRFWLPKDTQILFSLKEDVSIGTSADLESLFTTASDVSAMFKNVTITPPESAWEKVDLLGATSSFQNQILEQKPVGLATMTGTLVLDEDESVDNFIDAISTDVSSATYSRRQVGGYNMLSLDDFEGDWTDWIEAGDGKNPVTETTIIKEGVSSIHLGIDASADGGDVATWDYDVSDNDGAVVDLSAYSGANSGTALTGRIRVWVYINNLTPVHATNGVELWIGSSTANAHKFYLQKSALTAATWYWWWIDLTNPDAVAGTTDWTAIDLYRLRINETTSNSTDFEFYVDEMATEVGNHKNIAVGVNIDATGAATQFALDNAKVTKYGDVRISGADSHWEQDVTVTCLPKDFYWDYLD